MLSLIYGFHLVLYIHFGLQICLEEITNSGISVTWEQTVPANNVKSDPLCYYNDKLITRNCVDSKWEPVASELMPCLQIVNFYNISACPPGFDKISKNNHDNCYQIKEPSAWDYPCLKSGGASVITDLNDEDVISLLNSLNLKNVSQFFWMPAQRTKFFSPLVWHIPGSKWGHPVETNNMLNVRTSILKNCLLLDVQRQLLITETCTEIYPSLCFYINDIHYPAKCPNNYLSVRYMPDEGVCLGIEAPGTNLTYNDFINNKICNSSIGDKVDEDLARFVFKKIADINYLPDNEWCWFASSFFKEEPDNILNLFLANTHVSINNIGTLSLLNSNSLLPCMACQAEVIYERTQLLFEYNDLEKAMYLTIYFPSGLWKYSQNDRGIQCFSDGKGFVKVIDINDLPLIEVRADEHNKGSNGSDVDKIVYKINIITDRAAQYWCEGHTTNFSLIKTEILVVNPHGNEVHVFSLVINIYVTPNDIHNKLDVIISEICYNVTNIFSAKKVLLMEYLQYSSNYLMVLLHMDIAVDNVYEENGRNILRMYNKINKFAETDLLKYNYIFVNLSSSMFCLPTKTAYNSIILHWELTAIGHIAAPKQFCLQENGLPVKRLCDGSYLLGSIWGTVEGVCNQNYQPSYTTTFLYKFVKGKTHENATFRFLTDGLSFVLGDTDIIIPADIYYLSMSLKYISYIAQENLTLVDMGNINNIAWVMNRVMVLNSNYLRLAQTLNSTNVILDSLNNIIELLALKKNNIMQNRRSERRRTDYQLAVEPQFVLQISYPCLNNVSGLAIIKALSNNDSFTSMTIKPLFLNTTIEEVLLIENLEIATWLPNTVLSTLKKIKNDSHHEAKTNENSLHIIISIFHNDAIFQELEPNEYSLNSRIIGVSFPGYSTNLAKPIPLIYRDLIQSPYKKLCGYWNFQPHSVGNVPGYWSNNGCFLKYSNDSLTICDCYHLTHFGQLLNIGRYKNYTDPSTDRHTKPLNIISLVGSFLSLLGIKGIWITASVFQSWRKKAGTKVLLHLTTSIALPLVFMIVFNLDNTVFEEVNGIVSVSDSLRAVCISLGALLHYSVLASFMWMLITAALQFIRYVRVLGVYRPSRFMIKFTLIGWGTPIVPVIVVLALDKDNYIPNITPGIASTSLICYPSGFYLIVSVIVPICIILAINITLFILVICAISKGPDGKMRKADIDLIGAQLRLSIFLFFLLGLTWIFGILSFSNNPLWSYLFCLTSTMQGFVLFVYFILCDAQTRNLWVTLMKPQSLPDSSRKSITSISSN